MNLTLPQINQWASTFANTLRNGALIGPRLQQTGIPISWMIENRPKPYLYEQAQTVTAALERLVEPTPSRQLLPDNYYLRLNDGSVQRRFSFEKDGSDFRIYGSNGSHISLSPRGLGVGWTLSNPERADGDSENIHLESGMGVGGLAELEFEDSAIPGEYHYFSGMKEDLEAVFTRRIDPRCRTADTFLQGISSFFEQEHPELSAGIRLFARRDDRFDLFFATTPGRATTPDREKFLPYTLVDLWKRMRTRIEERSADIVRQRGFR